MNAVIDRSSKRRRGGRDDFGDREAQIDHPNGREGVGPPLACSTPGRIRQVSDLVQQHEDDGSRSVYNGKTIGQTTIERDDSSVMVRARRGRHVARSVPPDLDAEIRGDIGEERHDLVVVGTKNDISARVFAAGDEGAVHDVRHDTMTTSRPLELVHYPIDRASKRVRCGGPCVIRRYWGWWSVEGYMFANEIFDRYLESLLQTPNVWDKFVSGSAWTPEATRALANVGLQAFPTGQAIARGHRDVYGRSEYLTLDVCIADPNTWGPPLFIAEHENASTRAKIQYCTWKLLATRAQRRVLVAYFDVKSDVRDRASIEAAVREVCVDNPGTNVPNDILLITADANARPTSAKGLRELHAHSIVGILA